MIQRGTRLKVADNSGAKKVLCIGILGGTKKRYANVGDIISVSVKQAMPQGSVKKGSVSLARVVRTKKEIKRNDGTTLSFEDNAVVLIDANHKKQGSRIFGPIAKEVKKDSPDIASSAPELL